MKMGYYEISIEVPEESIEALINMLNDAGCVGVVENERNLLAYFPDFPGIEKIAGDISSFKSILSDSGLPHAFSFSCIHMPDRDWNETWKNNIQPIDVGESLTIVPPWKEPAAGRVSLIIDPGMAFGTGHHETTRTCLGLIERLSGEIPKDRFLDVGTGTGILAISAAKFGFREIYGVDTDPLAIDAAKRNVGLNEFTNVVIAEGTVSVSEGVYDMIASNLVSETLIVIATEIASRLKENGIVILSGMLVGQEDDVVAAMLKEGLKFREKHVDSERWVSLILTR